MRSEDGVGISAVVEEQVVQECGPPTPSFATLASSGNLGRMAARNSAGQAVGRLLIAATRLAIAAAIARLYGRTTFAEYSLLFGILTAAEWLLDFGTLDIMVREACRAPENSSKLLRIALAAKSIQFPVAFLLLMIFLLAMRYPGTIVTAGIPAGLSLLFYSGVLTCRIHFRATLAMHLDAIAEFSSVLLMLPLLALPPVRAMGLQGLAWSYLISRIAFLAIVMWLSGNTVPWWPRRVNWSDVKQQLATSSPIGVAGFAIVVYEALDIVLLSALSGVSQVAFYAGAQRFVWPVLTAQAAVAATLYPIAASCWSHARERFNGACQRGLELILVVAGLAVSMLIGGAAFLLSLLGHDLSAAAPALRILAMICFAKAISATLGPLLYIAGQQKQVLRVVAVALVAKAAIIASVAPRWGFQGVAWGVISADFCFATLPLIFLVRRFCGYRVQLSVPFKVIAASLASAALAMALPGGRIVSAVAAPLIYAPLVLLSGGVKWRDIESVLGKGKMVSS